MTAAGGGFSQYALHELGHAVDACLLRPCTSLPAHLHAELCMHMACRILEQLLGMVRGTTLIFE